MWCRAGYDRERADLRMVSRADRGEPADQDSGPIDLEALYVDA